MRLFNLHMAFGLILLMIGFMFDFIFVQSRISNAFKVDAVAYLMSFEKQMYDLAKFYMIVLGFLNIAIALLISYLGNTGKIDWIIFSLMVAGTILLIATGFWYAGAGPSFKWELRCTVLTIGLLAILVSMGLEIYQVLSHKGV